MLNEARGRWLAGLAAALALLGLPVARAETAPVAPLPTLALEPAPTPSIWHGLYVGTEVVAVSSKGGGGFGGDVFAGYSHEFSNNIVLALQGSTGYAPGWGNHALFRGFDFAATDVKVGYDLGRLTPYLTAGVALTRSHFGAALSAPGADSLNAVLSGTGEVHALTRVGAGVDYAVTNNLTVGVAVSAIQGRGPALP